MTNKFASLRTKMSKVGQIWTELDGELDGNWTVAYVVISTFVDILDLKLVKKNKKIFSNFFSKI